MTRGISYIRRAKRFGRDQAGATAILFGLMATGLMGAMGASVDVGHLLAVKGQLNARVQANALVGARALSETNANASTVGTAVANWNSLKPLTTVTVTNTTTTLACVSSTTNLPSCNATNPNSVQVTQTATVATYFLKIFGIPQFNLTSSATAAMAGGAGTPMQIMFVLDGTGSMNTADPGCNVPGISTRFQCAEYSVQEVMKQLQPSLTKVGLMAFPGTGTQYNPSSPCGTQPDSVEYLTPNIKYQIGAGLDATYNNGSGVLVASSPMVRAVGSKANPTVTACLAAKGGQGSYSAEVITKANAALPVIAGTENVIIMLSDGDFNADTDQINGSASSQCAKAVTAADTAAAAGTTIYSVAYGASLSGCGSSGDTLSACATMQAIASDPTKFYSTKSNCAISGSANNANSLPAILKQIAASLSKPRLVLN